MIQKTTHLQNRLPLSQLDIDKAFSLINEEEYELLVTFLTGMLDDAADNELPATWIEQLTLIRQLALTCHLFQKSAVWHQQTGEQAASQMSETAAVLRDFLHLLQGGSEAELTILPTIAVEESAYREVLNGHVNPGLWTRIKNLFHSNGDSSVGLPLQPVFTVEAVKAADNQNGTSPLNEGHVARNGLRNDTQPEVTLHQPSCTDDAYDDENTLLVYGLGVFCAYFQGQSISDWATRKSKSLFKYLLMNREKPVPKEILMEVFWPDSDETAARNNLNVTIYNLRQVLSNIDNTMSYVLYQDDCYYLNHDLHIWFDYEVFNQHYQHGVRLHQQAQFEEAVREFQTAELVYRGELFEEDRYDDWLLPRRESAHNHYVRVLEHLARHAYQQEQYMECINLCLKLLGVDDCLEDTYRLLMQSYMKQGQNHLAMRQYYTCVQALEDELGVLPSQDTVALYEQICTTITRG